MTKSMALSVLVLVSCAAWASATDYTVGDSSGWNLGVDYSTWASSKTFVVDDKLVFNYAVQQHDVEEVSSSDYSSCTSGNPIASQGNGYDNTINFTGGTAAQITTYTLSTAGKHYFICGVGTHCNSGMKLEVDVSASPDTSSPHPLKGTNSDNSAAGSLSAPLYAIAVLLGMMALKMDGLY